MYITVHVHDIVVNIIIQVKIYIGTICMNQRGIGPSLIPNIKNLSSVKINIEFVIFQGSQLVYLIA
jgi:hypothetical protein